MWREDDEIVHIDESIQRGEFEMSNEMQRVHLSNDIVHLIPEKRRLHNMYEDNDLEGLGEAEEFATWLEEHAPGAFILIDTGDYITPECSKNPDDAFRKHWNACELYDPYYALYLVPVAVWRDCEEQVRAADAEWRAQKNQCQLEKASMPDDDEEDEEGRLERQAQEHLEAAARHRDDPMF
jgi:hypothetical protein